MRFISSKTPVWILIVLAGLGYVFAQFSGCDNLGQFGQVDGTPIVENKVFAKSVVEPPSTGNAGDIADEIVVGTFNIQIFGQSKMQNAKVMQMLVGITRQFDVLAIQEIRSQDQSLIPRFVKLLNEQNPNGHVYDYLIGPRQGHTSIKEQYVFVYNTTHVEMSNPGFVYPDTENKFHRPPVVSQFRTRNHRPGYNPFTFSLINIHTDPDEVDTEIPALAEAYKFVVENMPNEDDIILLGDFNVDETKYGELASAIPNMGWVVSDRISTKTNSNRSYDNILFNTANTVEHTGKGGVFDFAKEYNLSKADAVKVSDHLPVWVKFRAEESQQSSISTVSKPRLVSLIRDSE